MRALAFVAIVVMAPNLFNSHIEWTEPLLFSFSHTASVARKPMAATREALVEQHPWKPLVMSIRGGVNISTVTVNVNTMMEYHDVSNSDKLFGWTMIETIMARPF